MSGLKIKRKIIEEGNKGFHFNRCRSVSHQGTRELMSAGLSVSANPCLEISATCLAVRFLQALRSLSITQFYSHDIIVSQSFEVVFPQSPQDTADINSKQHYNHLLPFQ